MRGNRRGQDSYPSESLEALYCHTSRGVEKYSAAASLMDGRYYFSTVYGQMSTMFVLQGNTLDPHISPNFKIPAASVSSSDFIFVFRLWLLFLFV